MRDPYLITRLGRGPLGPVLAGLLTGVLAATLALDGGGGVVLAAFAYGFGGAFGLVGAAALPLAAPRAAGALARVVRAPRMRRARIG